MIKLYICFLITGLIISFVLSTPDATCNTQSGASCESCLNISGCAYCKNNKKCFERPINPLNAPCTSGDLQMETCIADFRTLAIILGTVGGVLVIVVIVVICCCCKKCRQCSLRKEKKRQIVNERELEERRAAAEVRSTERNQKADQIRMKYGILKAKDTAAGYNRLS